MTLKILRHTQDLVGFGENIHRVDDTMTGKRVVYVSDVQEKKVVYFPSTILLEDLFKLVSFLKSETQKTT